MENIKVLSQNTIGQLRLTIPGGGPAITVALPRLAVPQNLVVPFGKQEPVSSNWQKPSALAGEPGILTLSATLGKRIGGGRTGVIFPLEGIELLPHPSQDVQLPSFVIKVGRPNRCAAILREAWFYEKLELLQGVAIPRYYGWFETELLEDSAEYTWKHENLTMTENLLDQTVVDQELSNSVHPHKWLRTRCYNPDIFSCLLLERLGEVLPRGQEKWQETNAQAIHKWCVEDMELAVYPEAEEPEPSFEVQDPRTLLNNTLA
ncbi:hypothetical protein EWM64_g5884 [Hericium alpestre]|uniref:Protein kinase domain-containing protein n=1 Tax=Hericium alpestre TaxID=135208 RepID=A0A4Y9ZT97_9AGAM|nr:hypothetical protein EWM64_g5884 [Hericium alpestre]